MKTCSIHLTPNLDLTEVWAIWVWNTITAFKSAMSNYRPIIFEALKTLRTREKSSRQLEEGKKKIVVQSHLLRIPISSHTSTCPWKKEEKGRKMSSKILIILKQSPVNESPSIPPYMRAIFDSITWQSQILWRKFGAVLVIAFLGKYRGNQTRLPDHKSWQ